MSRKPGFGWRLSPGWGWIGEDHASRRSGTRSASTMRFASGNFTLIVRDSLPTRGSELVYEGWHKTAREAMRKGDELLGVVRRSKKKRASLQPIEPMWLGTTPACSKCGRNFVADENGRVRKGKKDVVEWFCPGCASAIAGNDVAKLASEVKGLLK